MLIHQEDVMIQSDGGVMKLHHLPTGTQVRMQQGPAEREWALQQRGMEALDVLVVENWKMIWHHKEEQIAVRGNCPSCGMPDLFAVNGQIICGAIGCDEPDLTTRILEQHDINHIVNFDEGMSWTIMHPLHERADGDLFDCPLTDYLFGGDQYPELPGRYRATPRYIDSDEAVWDYEMVD